MEVERTSISLTSHNSLFCEHDFPFENDRALEFEGVSRKYYVDTGRAIPELRWLPLQSVTTVVCDIVFSVCGDCYLCFRIRERCTSDRGFLSFRYDEAIASDVSVVHIHIFLRTGFL